MLTAAQLEIKEEEFSALIQVRANIKNGVYKQWPTDTNINDKTLLKLRKGGKQYIYMRCSMECGTVGCIGGWMGLIITGNKQLAIEYVHHNHSPNLHNLFFPDGNGSMWEKITPPIMLKVINEFLETGIANYKKEFIE